MKKQKKGATNAVIQNSNSGKVLQDNFKKGIVFTSPKKEKIDRLTDEINAMDKKLRKERGVVEKKEFDQNIKEFLALSSSVFDPATKDRIKRYIDESTIGQPSIEMLEEIVSEYKKRKEVLRVEILPAFFHDLDIMAFTTKEGDVIKMKRVVSGRVADIKKFIAWAKKKKVDGLIETTLEMNYREYNKELKAFLEENGYNVKVKENTVFWKKLDSLFGNIATNLEKEGKGIAEGIESGELPSEEAATIKIVYVVSVKESIDKE